MENKVKVKIAVAIDKNGDWSSCGYGGKNKKFTVDNLFDYMADLPEKFHKRYVIEVELDVPQVETIKCEVIEIGE